MSLPLETSLRVEDFKKRRAKATPPAFEYVRLSSLARIACGTRLLALGFLTRMDY